MAADLPAPPRRRTRAQLYTSIGANMRCHRTQRRLSQAQLAADLNVLRSTLANLEAGRQQMYVHTLLDLAAALDVDVEDLLADAPPTATPPREDGLEEENRRLRARVAQLKTRIRQLHEENAELLTEKAS